MSNEVTTTQQDPNAKNVINYEPLFPVLTASINLDLAVEDMASDLFALATDTINCEGGFTTYTTGQNIDHIRGINEVKQAIYGVACAMGRELKMELNYDKASIHVWANVMRRDGHEPVHNHKRGVFSGTFVVHADEKDSPLVIENPTEGLRMHEGFVRPQDYTAFTAPSIAINPKVNQLVIWPSWLYYQVPKMQTSGPRVTFGFTVDFLPPGV